MNIRLLAISILLFHSVGMFCNFYPLDEKACILKTEGISCNNVPNLGQFNFFQNACIETQSTSLGCSPNLNKNACLQQLQNPDGTEARCYFGKKCVTTNNSHLKKLGCLNNFSQYACVNVRKQCQWINNSCQEGGVQQADSCKNTFMTPVSPSLCATIPDLKCYNNGFQGGYQCVEAPENQLFTCDTLGLSQMACVSITTTNQRCLFQNSQCQSYGSQKINKCSDPINKALCLSITDPQLFCHWTNTGCAEIVEFDCESLIQVNPSACRKASGLCKYDDVLNKCKLMQVTSVSCNTPGLNKEGCLKINTEKCIYKGQCRVVNIEELNLFDCDQIFNELACTSVTTPSQYCMWDGNKCSRLFVNQETECPLLGSGFTVNGNTCRAVSKYNQGCKYNKLIRLCQANSPFSDSCTTSFLNLYGCVQVQTNIACRWNSDKFQCEEAKVVEQLTKCEDLGFANSIACSQIIEPITIINNIKLVVGCYYNSDVQQCKKTDNNILSSINCNQLGLNKYGCSQISKVGQRCRWIRGTCTTITRRESIAGVNCLDLQFSNQGTCALAQANKEVCKYSQEALGCVNTLNTSKDGDQCLSPGLNSFACAQITRNQSGCYFDKINNVCVEGPDSTSSDQATALQSTQLLSTAKCVASSPTLNICIAIKTLGELCAWDNRLNGCGYQYVQFNEKCLDYNTIEKQKTNPDAKINVNANVCASIVMNFPDYDPKAALPTTEALRGYCQFDGKGNCIVYTQTPCSDYCCTNLVGINAHVCSRYTNRGVYCYFNEYNKCVQLTNDDTNIGSPEQIKAFYNYKQYKCSSMNYLSCTMIEWSSKQQCYWNGNVCTQINYGDYAGKNYQIQFEGAKLSKYACLGIEANKSNITKYFNYYPATLPTPSTCIYDPAALVSCKSFQVNMNKCLGKTPDVYCQWDKLTMQCNQIDDPLNLKTCNEYQNKKACIENPYVPCLFIDSSDKCISSPQEVNCNDFIDVNNDYFGWVNQKACANISKAGQICKYNGVTCVNAADNSQTCDLPGINSIGCYARTTGNCRWDPTKLECYEIDLAILPTLKCTDNINKTVCLIIPSYPCEWNALSMKCAFKSSFLTIDTNTQQNPQSCTQMNGAAYYYDDSTSTCKILTSDDNNCTSKIMNKQACLLNTKGSNCYFDYSQLPELKCQQFKFEQEVCSTSVSINLEICMNIPSICYFDTLDLSCKVSKLSSTIKCSSLMSLTQHYNKLSCSSISNTITDPYTAGIKACTSSPNILDSAQQCNFEKYCFWDTTLYGCSIYKIVNSSFSPATSGSNGSSGSAANCALSARKISSCEQIYSIAVCLEFGDGCFFDITQGGCKPYTPNSFKVSGCSQINGKQCTSSKTATAYCASQTAEDLQPNCEFTPPILSTCISDATFVKQSCSSLSSSNTDSECALASDDCFLNTNCVTPTSNDIITCTTPGVSQSLCLSLTPPCDFSSGKCTPLTIPTLEPDNYYYVCNEVNLLTTKKSEMVCASITTSPCKYSSLVCSNAFYQTCTSLKGLSVSQLACSQCQGDKSLYDFVTYQCSIITALPTDCDTLDQSKCTNQCTWDSGKCHINVLRLNQLSCLQLTDKILAKWDSNLNNCVLLTTNQAQAETDCSIQSVKSCLVANNTCWVSSITNQCEQNNKISSSCAAINSANAQSSQCLVSVQQACKWVNNTCAIADLTVDDCSILNKFGCLNIQRKITCGWSDKDTKCKQISLQNSNSCSKYVGGGDSDYNQVNPYSCSSLTNSKCYWNSSTNQCASVGNTIISCTTNLGINQTACILLTIGKCKFDTSTKSCVEITSADNTCSNLMNQEACLSLSSCQFVNNSCTNFTLTTDLVIANLIPANNAAISPLICTYYNNSIANAYFIYDQTRGYCVNVNKTNPSLYIAQCSSIGVNSKICLEKTNEYCINIINLGQFNEKCTEVSVIDINAQTSCNNTYNWYACIKQTQNCKFLAGKCVPLLSTDTCALLSSAIVAPKLCAQMSDACSYNQTTYGCQLIPNDNQLCSTIGISKKGCLEKTSESYCYFDVQNNQCSDNYDRSLTCLDANNQWYINMNLCYFVKSLGSYCYFDKDKGQCRQLTDAQVSKCYATSKTNSITCSKATSSILCFYDTTDTTDTTYKVCSQKSDILQTQKWYNSSSFNKKACISFDSLTDPHKTIWDDILGCIELQTADLANIQCSSPVNRLGCVYITNPTQYCQFIIEKCVGFDYTVPPSNPIGPCASLKNVNRFEFCQYAEDNCQYNGATRSCAASNLDDSKILSETDCFNKGLSKAICNPLQLCTYNDERKFCYGGNVFCADTTNLSDCPAVKGEPCRVYKNLCEGIKYSDLVSIRCSDVSNQIGCASITNPSIVCQFDQNTKVCNEIVDFTKDCSTYTNINSGKVCEQTTKIGCKFDFASKSCKNISVSDVFECDRGLNYIACTTQTRPSLQCQFGKFCFGPTFGVNKCSDILNSSTCLNYNYQCIWDTNECKSYALSGLTCQQLQTNKTVVSSQVCYNSQADQGACIYNTDTNTCQFIKPQNCQQLETKQQCIKFKDLPCLWIDGQCTFYTLLSTDLCSTIGQNGSQRACMDVYRQGEFCKYSNNQCQAFQELIDGQTNCLDSINIISCVQQQKSQCFWKITQSLVYINQKDQIQYNTGICNDYQPDPYQNCDQKLSYLSCFSITKKGQFCRWLNGQCQYIIPTTSNTKIYYNSYQLINPNSCGLVNVGKVKYQYETKSCILINNDILTCKCGQETQGLNKYACLSIKNENCIWNDAYKICLEHHTPCSSNRLLTLSQCYKSNVQPKDCQLLNIPQNCGYYNGNCIEIDVKNVTCNTPGLNQYSCENIRSCNWENGQCQVFNSEAQILGLIVLIIIII